MFNSHCCAAIVKVLLKKVNYYYYGRLKRVSLFTKHNGSGNRREAILLNSAIDA